MGSVHGRGKCPRHPRFDPYMRPRGDQGRVDKCNRAVDIPPHHIQMLSSDARVRAPAVNQDAGWAKRCNFRKILGEF